MWSETVGLRTRRSATKKIGLGHGLGLVRCGLGLDLGLAYCSLDHGLAGLVLFCEKRSCHARRQLVIMVLKDTATFQELFIVSLFCAWNITTVEINSGVHLLKS